MGFNKKPRFVVSYELFYNSCVVTYEVTDLLFQYILITSCAVSSNLG